METPLRRSTDIISNLPEEVMETILVHLPIRDAVMTSLLSNKWRYKWTTIPILVFDEDDFRSSTNRKKFRIYKLVNFVDRVLLHHKGSIHNGVLYQYAGQGEASNLVRVLGCLIGLEKLDIGNCFMEFLAIGNLPKRLPVTYDCLKSISLYINLEDLNETLVMLCLFQSSPNLQELEMVANKGAADVYVEDFWKEQGCSMNQLRLVNISIFGARAELEFIQFLLAHSPVLEILSVNHFAQDKIEESRVRKDLVRFRRASTKAEIEYRGHCSPRGWGKTFHY